MTLLVVMDFTESNGAHADVASCAVYRTRVMVPHVNEVVGLL